MFPGFTYTLNNGEFDGVRLEFSVALDELWTEWCALQTPIYDEINDRYGCVHNWSFSWGADGCSQPDPDSGQDISID